MSYNDLIGGFSLDGGHYAVRILLGRAIPADQMISICCQLSLLVLFVSVVPSVWHIIKENRADKRIKLSDK
jgi:membrane-associated protein